MRQECLGQLDGVIVFCVPPDVFEWWRAHNSVQSFVTQGGRKPQIHLYLNSMKQMVMCVPGDGVEEEQMKALMNL